MEIEQQLVALPTRIIGVRVSLTLIMHAENSSCMAIVIVTVPKLMDYMYGQ
jgi:hypothetical protein